MSSARRVVVTGLGVVSPLGIGAKHAWKQLISGKSGLVSTSSLKNADQFKDIPSKVVGKLPITEEGEDTVPGSFKPSDHFTSHELRRFSPFIQYALVAAEEALKDSGLNTANMSIEEQYRTGVCIGSGIGSIDDSYSNSVALSQGGYRKLQPLFVPKLLTNMASGNVSIKYGFKGVNHSVSTACATGVHSIGDSFRFIRDDYADVIVCGASEAAVHPLALGGFARAKSVTTKFENEPWKASRPFDKDRSGFVLGEGCGILILEELEHALARNAKIYAEIKGYGLSGDSNHITTPSKDGDGAKRAMEMALKNGNVKPENINYINAHATSTPLGDRAENYAIKRIFGDLKDSNLRVSSNKGQMGHLLGAAGAVESIFTILAINNNIAPPTMNCDNPGMHAEDNTEEDFIFDYVSNQSQKIEINHALSNSFGFGGTNASLCISKFVK